jgi:hypothetical protein
MAMNARLLGSLMAASFLLLGSALLPSTPAAFALGDETKKEEAKKVEKEDRPTVDATQVYYGKAATCKSPATVDADQVFRAIPEYKTILADRLTEADARYSLLMVKATKKFRAAVEAAAGGGGYDLVGNTGSVSWPGHDVPDITASVLQKVEEAEKAR